MARVVRALGGGVEAVERLLRAAAGLPPARFSALIDSLGGLEEDLAAAQAALVVGAMETWVRWESECVDGPGSELCGHVEEMVRGSGDVGVVSFFNTRIKVGIVSLYRDFSPGLAVPRWIIYYTAFVLREPLLRRLAGLGVEEQLARYPVFAAAMRFIEHRARLLAERHRGGVAGATATYIYGEVVAPAARPAEYLERVLGLPPQRPRSGRASAAVAELARIYREALTRRLLEIRKAAARQEG